MSQRVGPVTGLGHVIAVVLQQGRQRVAKSTIVIDDQDAGTARWRHRQPPREHETQDLQTRVVGVV